MSFPIHLVTMLRMCGAQTLPLPIPLPNIMISPQMLMPALVGGLDSDNLLGALISQAGSNIKMGNVQIPPIAALKDMASGDIRGLIPHITGLPIPMQGAMNVFMGQGTAAAGLGFMQQLGLGSFGALSIGELVSVAGQVIGMVQNFTAIGGGAAVAQLSNLQGSPITPGTTVTGLTSGYTFTFANYLDSRLFDNVLGAASYGPANSYPDITTVSNSIIVDTDSDYDFLLGDTGDYFIMEDGAFVVLSDPLPNDNYLVIDDYIQIYPLMNLTASVITT